MVISAFVLGIFAAIVAILIAVIIVIMLKMASMKKSVEGLEKELFFKWLRVERIEGNISTIDEALMREVDSVGRDLKEGLERVLRDAFAGSKSYTDSRIDKLTEPIKK